MAITVSKKVKVEEVTCVQYTTSDGKVFDRPDKAEVHEELIGLEQKFKDFGIKTVDEAYFCKTEEELKTVVNLLAYREANFRWPSGKFEPYFRYQNVEFSGPDWYSSCMRQTWTIQMSTGWKHCRRKRKNSMTGLRNLRTLKFKKAQNVLSFFCVDVISGILIPKKKERKKHGKICQMSQTLSPAGREQKTIQPADVRFSSQSRYVLSKFCRMVQQFV